MKKLCVILALCLLLTGCTASPSPTESLTCVMPCQGDHIDGDGNGLCERCAQTTLVTVDFYSLNDLHGKIADADTHPGVDELSTYLDNARRTDDHTVLLSIGDMWQGSSESNLTQGMLATEWMNEMGFDAMTMGNHEYDWGKTPIEANAQLAQFPLLAINVYDRQTDTRVSYCESSLIVEAGEAKIGIIGAMGDCYSSIAQDKVGDVYFKTGADLTRLVKDEATRLRGEGADFIVYLLHDGYGKSKSATPVSVRSSELRAYYDTALSDGYVDLVFEGHTHQRYILRDEHGVYHLQNKGDNKGISHVEVAINTANSAASQVQSVKLISTGDYAKLEDHPIVEQLLEKYRESIGSADDILGTNAARRDGTAMRQLVADLYYETGVARWGDEYDIALGGGFMSIRSPGYLAPGDVTYAMLYELFPFDNQLVLCSIKGEDLQDRFFQSGDDRYFISYGDYGRRLKEDIDPDETYYVIVDSYSSTYGPNRLTEIERYDENIYARDLLAEYARAGGFE